MPTAVPRHQYITPDCLCYSSRHDVHEASVPGHRAADEQVRQATVAILHMTLMHQSRFILTTKLLNYPQNTAVD